VPDGAEIDGASPAFAETIGSADAEPEEIDEPAESEIFESDIPESGIEVTPKNMAPTIVKTRATARTVRNDFFMSGSLPFSFSLRCIRLAVVKPHSKRAQGFERK
jgi:hypothetical protein